MAGKGEPLLFWGQLFQGQPKTGCAFISILKKKMYYQNPGRSKLGREIHFHAMKVSLKNNCYVFLFTQGKRGGMNMFGQPLFRQKPEQVLVHQTQARE